MSYSVRLMRREDVAEVSEIDREAFPASWPAPHYDRELENALAHLIVAVKDGEDCQPRAAAAKRESFGSRVVRLFRPAVSPPETDRKCVAGFAGFWIMAGEAHITTIAVRQSHRGQSIGELLLIALVELARELGARLLTLEVRVSNKVAQSLYAKYGFAAAGVRRRYYIDNGEDALLMSIEDINAASFLANFGQLKEAYARSRGAAPRVESR